MSDEIWNFINDGSGGSSVGTDMSPSDPSNYATDGGNPGGVDTGGFGIGGGSNNPDISPSTGNIVGDLTPPAISPDVSGTFTGSQGGGIQAAFGPDWQALPQSTRDLLNSIGQGPNGEAGDGTGGLSPAAMAQLAQLVKVGGPAAISAITAAKNSGPNGLTDFFKGIGGQITNGLSSGLPLAAMLPYLGMAVKQFNDAGKYSATGKEAAGVAAKFTMAPNGQQQYIDRLDQSWKDPGAFLNNDPGYKFQMQQGLAGLGQAAAGNGSMAFSTNGGATGQYAKDIMDYSQGLAATTLAKDRDQLGALATNGNSPYAAANAIVQGNTNSIAAQNSALANIGGMLQAARTGGNSGSAPPPGAPPPTPGTAPPPPPLDQTGANTGATQPPPPTTLPLKVPPGEVDANGNPLNGNGNGIWNPDNPNYNTNGGGG